MSNAGRPSKFDKKYCQMLIDHMSSGLSFMSFAGVIGTHFDTLYEWEKKYPEFSEAKRQGKAALLLWDEKLLNDGAQGKRRGYNINAHKWKMANVHKWSDRVETTLNTAKMSDDELIQKAHELLAQIEPKHDQD